MICETSRMNNQDSLSLTTVALLKRDQDHWHAHFIDDKEADDDGFD